MVLKQKIIFLRGWKSASLEAFAATQAMPKKEAQLLFKSSLYINKDENVHSYEVRGIQVKLMKRDRDREREKREREERKKRKREGKKRDREGERQRERERLRERVCVCINSSAPKCI